MVCAKCGVRRWVRYETDGRGHDIEVAERCGCEPEISKPNLSPASSRVIAPSTASAKRGTLSKEIREALKAIIAERPQVTFMEAHREVEKRLGREIGNGNTHFQWKRVHEELGAALPPNATGGARQVSKPPRDSATAQPTSAWRDEIHLELDGDGFQLRVDLRFSSPDDAAKAAAGFCRAMGIVEGQFTTHLESTC